MSHSSIAPSSAHIWAPANGCRGWRKMSARYPEVERSEAAEQGTAAHELAASMLKSVCEARVGFPVREDVVGTPAANGVIYDDSMYDMGLAYIEILEPIIQSAHVYGGKNIGIEEKVSASRLHPDLWGSVDFFLYDQDRGKLHVYDYKYGYGPVDAFKNWQLICYAAGAIETLGINDTTLDVSLNIVQPRLYSFDGAPSQWDTTLLDLGFKYFPQLREGAAGSFQDNAPVHTGAHCKYCRARHACPAAIGTALQLYETTTEAVPVDMAPVEMADAYTVLLRAQAHIRSMIIGYEEQLKAAARGGDSIPGYRAEPTYGYVTWERPLAEVLKLGEMFGINLQKKEAITPNQAKSAGMDPAIVDTYSVRPLRGVKLVHDDGKLARKVFES